MRGAATDRGRSAANARRLLLLAMFLGVLLLAGCGGGQAEGGAGTPEAEKAPPTSPAAPEAEGEEVSVGGGSFARVSPEGLRAMLENKDFTLVNVHIPFEGNLPDTDLSIRYDEIGRNTDRLPGKDEGIVLYCKSGRMSVEAAKTLVGLGYTNVRDLKGGMDAWGKAGLPLEGA